MLSPQHPVAFLSLNNLFGWRAIAIDGEATSSLLPVVPAQAQRVIGLRLKGECV